MATSTSVHTAVMVERAARVLDVERVTRRFYDRFKLERDAFLKFIQGIPSKEDREWYASLMLNRLMCIYFIQRKGFLDTKTPGALDGDPHYLSNRLKWVQQQCGEDQFHSFYRYFLLPLFHDGLSKRERSPELEVLLGNIPYLNGGLFDIHTLERSYPDLNIPDEAFEKLFSFFDDYDWRLDDRPLRNEKDINPDVLGYIFEKDINQKQMGAYYTKEDITRYISKNTIIPYIFDAAQQQCPVAFNSDGPAWSLLRADPDRYIYEAVKKGSDLPLPPKIEAGLHDVAQRDEWNRTAPEEYALPSEIWREVVARHNRYQEVRAKLAAGEITSINDLVTYNLDIVAFAGDAISNCGESDLLRAFYESIRSVTVLDPTCGSGAFLFAALNILERLYEACLERMQQMIDERDLLDAALLANKRQQHPRLDYFRAILREIASHPSRTYFIYKSIIINNLYGVDIMEEATEICKLRLFLKLVSQASQFNDIESLPGIGFNIRAGNTLVGFASEEETKRAIEGKTTGKGSTREERAFQNQVIFDDRLEQKAQDQPFHWWVEFYGIMKRGGFDVIIGNPPYVEYGKVRGLYTIQQYMTASCGNLYAYTVERSLKLQHRHSRFGMIVPHSAFCTDRMEPLMDLCIHSCVSMWISTYCIRPAKLFAGVDQRLAIFVSEPGAGPAVLYSTQYHRWQEEARPALFTTLEYKDVTGVAFHNSIPKIHTASEKNIWKKLTTFRELLSQLSDTGTPVFFHNAPRYWIRAMTFAPYFWNERDGEQISSHVKSLLLSEKIDSDVVAGVMNSSLFYWWFIVLSNCRDLTMREIEHFPLGLDSMRECDKQVLASICQRLMDDYRRHAVRKEAQYKATGRVIYDEFYPRHSKPIIDEIDRVLAQHYGFTGEELDFIINYDIKYRMGQNQDDEGEEQAGLSNLRI
ncbi:MAG TPA: DNA methyltransferase [Ktedonobacteraceae bacterium]|nr:DNA methyltransferase [Ktedonobacteraceae bacterium]